MPYLITGGAGFIGSSLVRELGAEHCVVFDDFSSGKKENLPEGCRVIEGDIRDAGAVARALEGLDGCFHLAAIASVEACRREWQAANAVNLGGSLNVFMAAKALNLPVVYASSAAVYGSALPQPVSEAMRPSPESLYAADKLSAELHAKAMGLKATGLRLFNVYGPRQEASSPYAGVISLFAARARNGETVTVHGDGLQTRDFIAVSDVARAFALSMQALRKGAHLPTAMNICTGQAVTIRQLAEMVGARYALGLPRAEDVRFSCGNPWLAEQNIHFTATVPLAEGLKQTLDWMRACGA